MIRLLIHQKWLHALQVKPLFPNNTQGEYGPSYTFQFTGKLNSRKCWCVFFYSIVCLAIDFCQMNVIVMHWYHLTTHAPGATLASPSTGEGQVDKKFIALAIVLTFSITTIIVTILVLALVWLFMTCREKRSAKCNGSNKPMELRNFYGDKNDNQ